MRKLLIVLLAVMMMSVPFAGFAQDEPAVGGTFVIAEISAPLTLDPHTPGSIGSAWFHMGASLIIVDPTTNELVPYLAESWTISEDGLVYEFKLREDVLFHNGAPLTAEDYAFTFSRMFEPERGSAATGPLSVIPTSIEVVDTYTFRITLPRPHNVMLLTLSNPALYAPLPKAYIEEVGDEGFAQAPVSVGPFRLREWVAGERVVLERNPDFAWGPAFSHGGAPYIETLEIIPLALDVTVAALEANEITSGQLTQPGEVIRLEEAGAHTVYRLPALGEGLRLQTNVTVPPLDDLRVRQAISHGIDRQIILDVAASGEGILFEGPITPNTAGYWEGVEELGYEYDPEQAIALLEEAGYTMNDDGRMEKDGVVLTFSIGTPDEPVRLNTAQIIQQMLGEIGIEVTIQVVDNTFRAVATGEVSTRLGGIFWPDYSVIGAYSSTSAFNGSRWLSEELDALIETMLSSSDPVAAEQALQDAQAFYVENAVNPPLFAPYFYFLLSNDVEGERFSERYANYFLFDAYFND